MESILAVCVTPIGQLTVRDLEVLSALDRAPHTALQLLRLSGSFSSPFSVERLVRRRLHQLTGAGLVRRAVLTGLASRGGSPNVYMLTPLGYRVLHGPGAAVPSKRFGTPPAVSRHRHTHALSEFIVHLHLSAHREGIGVAGFCRENSVLLTDGPDSSYPDSAFQLVLGHGQAFSYFVELDAGTERICSPKEDDSWERKVRIYQAVRAQTRVPFRVLVLTLNSSARAEHILKLARARARNPQCSMLYAARLDAFLTEPNALSSPLFRDHFGRSISMLPKHVVEWRSSAIC